MLLYPDEEHHYHAIEEPWYVHWISFSGHHIPSMLHYLDMDHTAVYRVSDSAILASRIRRRSAPSRVTIPSVGSTARRSSTSFSWTFSSTRNATAPAVGTATFGDSNPPST
jgi:hypothetical protein